MRRHDSGTGCGARARGSQATHPGGAGAPPGTTMSPCEELADGGPLRPVRGLGRAVDPEGAANSRPEAGRNGPRKARPGAAVKTPRVARREAPHLRKEVRHTKDGRAAWRATSLACSEGRKRKTAYPGPQRTGAMMLGCLTTESVRYASMRRPFFSPPPCGEGSGVGVEVILSQPPPPGALRAPPSPQGGG